MSQEIAELIVNEHTKRLFISLTDEYTRKIVPSPQPSEAIELAKDRYNISQAEKKRDQWYQLSEQEIEKARTVEEIRSAWAGIKDHSPELEYLARTKWNKLSLDEIRAAKSQIEIINAVDMSPMNPGCTARPLGIIRWDEISLEAVQVAGSDLELAITGFLSHRNSEAKRLAIEKLKALAQKT